jgi:predicted nucleotidyltransferase
MTCPASSLAAGTATGLSPVAVSVCAQGDLGQLFRRGELADADIFAPAMLRRIAQKMQDRGGMRRGAWVLAGSHLYGLAGEGSDVDVGIVAIEPSSSIAHALLGNPSWLVDGVRIAEGDEDVEIVGLLHVLFTLNKGSMSNVERLYAPTVGEVDPLWEEVREFGRAHLARTKRSLRSALGSARRDAKGGEWKKKSHALRFLLQAIELAEEGISTSPLPSATLLLKVKRGEMPEAEYAQLVADDNPKSRGLSRPSRHP